MNHAVLQEHASRFEPGRLVRTFSDCFESSHNTVLSGGAAEPVYLPSPGPGQAHRLLFREDYFASALHEAAHWCIAGEERRLLRDFGYWYAPEGRDPAQQAAFEAVEVKPQALEWCFSLACGYPFQVSVDNLDPVSGALPDTTRFRSAVTQQARAWQASGLPRRAARFFDALAREFGTGLTVDKLVFPTDNQS